MSTINKIIAFDMDKTIIKEGHDKMLLCTDTLKILEYLYPKYKLCIISHNNRAQEILKSLKIDRYFAIICGYNYPNSKKPHFENMFEGLEYKCAPNDIYFFDDIQAFVSEARVLGINSYLVEGNDGIKYD